jgi:hypothetical protein
MFQKPLSQGGEEESEISKGASMASATAEVPAPAMEMDRSVGEHVAPNKATISSPQAEPGLELRPRCQVEARDDGGIVERLDLSDLASLCEPPRAHGHCTPVYPPRSGSG